MMRQSWPAYIGKAVAPRGGMISSETTKNGSRAGGAETVTVTSHQLLCWSLADSSSCIGNPSWRTGAASYRGCRRCASGPCRPVPLHLYVDKSIAIDPQRHPWHWSCPCRTEELARFWLATVAVPDHATPLRAP